VKPGLSPAAWLSRCTAANPEVFTAGLIASASTALRDAGLPATVDELRAIEEVHDNGRLVARTAGNRIEHDDTLPEQVRIAAEIIYRADQVRQYIAKARARDVAAETARLFGAVFRALEIDAERYMRAGIRQVETQKAGTAANQEKADERRRIVTALRDEEQQRHLKFSPDRILILVAERAKKEYPGQFKSTFSKTSARNLLDKK
jgi:hypothetical protein